VIVPIQQSSDLLIDSAESTGLMTDRLRTMYACETRDLHGNGDNGNTAVMGTVVTVILRERLLLKRYYRGSGHRIW